MRESRVELCVGDSVRLDDQILTVIDISEDEITIRVDWMDDGDAGAMQSENCCVQLRPR